MKRNLLKLSVIAVLVGGSALATAVDMNSEEFKELKDDFDTFINDYYNFETEVDAKLHQHSDALGRHTNRLNNLKNLVEDAQDDLDEAFNRIEELEVQSGKLEENIATKADKTEVDTLTNKVNGAAAALGLLSQSVGKSNANIADNASKIATKADKTEVDTLTNRVDGAAEALDLLSQSVDKNETAIAANKTSITDHQTDIATNKADIATNKADIAIHTQRLDNLDNRVNNLNKDLKRGLASQAALNGLFQPYNVGKLNLTAAVGGYKSQTAVAVGTGYRHNENIAAKAGVAFTRGGSATYNVGVNFEW